MANPTLADQIKPQTQQQIFQLLLSYYQAAGYPTTAWEQGGPDIARNQAFATALSDFLTNYVPAIAGGGLLDYAPNYTGWMELLAQQIFNLTQNVATFTQGAIVATNTSGTSYSYSPSSPLIAVFSATGNRYISQGTGTIAAGGTPSITFQAEFAGSSYADPSNANPSNTIPTALTLVTPLPGVWLNNPSQSYSSITHVGTGTGTIVASGTPSGAHTVVISITSTGQAGVATWSYALDGAAAVNAGSVSSLTIPGTGIVVTLSNGAFNPSFVNGDAYSFSTPAPWITSQGANDETATALATRCRNRWASLSSVPTMSLYQLLATSTPNVGSQVTQVAVVPDSTINNKVNIIIAGPGGVLPGSTISAVQAYITPRARGCDNPVVQSPTQLAITIAATVTVLVSQIAAAQNAITTALQNYIASIPINGTIRLATIIKLIDQVDSVVDVSGVTINGSAANLVLGGVGSYVLPTYPPTLNMVYNGQ